TLSICQGLLIRRERRKADEGLCLGKRHLAAQIAHAKVTGSCWRPAANEGGHLQHVIDRVHIGKAQGVSIFPINSQQSSSSGCMEVPRREVAVLENDRPRSARQRLQPL